MTEILRFLVEHLSFLYAPGRYRFVDSETSAGFGDAVLVLASENLGIRLVRDRGQLHMDLRAAGATGKLDWHSIDVVHALITGELPSSSELSPQYARFLEQHLDEIERRFSRDEVAQTTRSLEDLERARAKKLFG